MKKEIIKLKQETYNQLLFLKEKYEFDTWDEIILFCLLKYEGEKE